MNPLSVTQFNQIVNELLDPLEVIVEGEISQWQVWQGKYIYAAIKDDNALANIFASVFKVKNFNSLKVGMKVVIKGKPSLHIKSGKFSIEVNEITPIGDGALSQAFDILKQKLEDEGLFSKSRKRLIPIYPISIGFITAKDSQAYNDFVKIMDERWCGATIHFYPTQVQGSGSVTSIVEAIEYFNSNFTNASLDVLVIARGGGSIEDLISFNDEKVVRAVYASKFPVVSGVGHEGDITLIDLVSDLRASTPSNAAELISPDKQDLKLRLNQFEGNLNRNINLIVENTNRNLIDLIVDLDKSVLKNIDDCETRLSSFTRILNTYDYKNTLKRGFAVIRDNKNDIVKNSLVANKSKTLKIEFQDSEVDVVVKNDITSKDDIIQMF